MGLILVIVAGLIGANFGTSAESSKALMKSVRVDSRVFSQTRPGAVASSRICDASRQPGADVGAKVNSCGRILGPGTGEIRLTGGGMIATQILLSGHTLKLFGKGVYSSKVDGPAIVLDNNSTLECASWDSILEEGNAPEASPGVAYSARTGQTVFTIVQSKSGISGHAGKNERLRVEGCHFRGARKDFNSAAQTVSLGNCENCVARNNWFESVHSIALQAGGTANSGNSARNILFENNLFTGSVSQNLALTNIVGAIVRKNRFIAPGLLGGPGTAVIDVEPNAGDVVDDVLIEDNLIDATDAPVGPGGPQTNAGIVVNAQSPTRGFRNVRIIANRIIGSPPNAPWSRISYAGILLRGAPGVLVERNFVQRVNRGILLDSATTGAIVRGNTLLSCGSGGTGAIEIDDSWNNVVVNNIMSNAPGETVYAEVTSRSIKQSGASRNNRVEGNGPRN